MKYLLSLLLFLSLTVHSADTIAFGGDIYLALENWQNVGAADDSKMGFGVGADFGIGMKVLDMKLLVGPHIGYNKWTQDYSNKTNSATSSVYVSMLDTGMVLMADFDDFILKLGAGSGQLGMGFTVNGKTYNYTQDGTSYAYQSVNIGFNFKPMVLGFGVTTYSELKAANRCEFMIGIGF
jgi:hypothetical protein